MSFRIALLLLAATSLTAQEVTVTVGPNFLASRDGDVPHCETMIAANPQDPKNLVGGAITATRPDGGWAVRSYATGDGGITWRYSDFPLQLEYGGADPQVVFTPDGTAVFLALSSGSVVDDEGKERGGMEVHRSTDGGFTWEQTQVLCCSHDHPQTAVDLSTGRYAGRIYVGTLHDYPVYRVSVFRSDDGGRTFTGPVEAANGGGDIGINVMSTSVLSDGTLLVPYVDFEFKPEKRITEGVIAQNFWMVTSEDGGVSFSKPAKIVTYAVEIENDYSHNVPVLATSSVSKRFRDHVYVAYTDVRLTGGKPRILFTRSTDKGKTWSKPVPITPDVPEHTMQSMPTAAVNEDGVFGVYWFDTRHSPDGSEYHVWFAASADGGATFLEPVRVSTEPSIPGGAGNIRPMGTTWNSGDVGMLTLLSAANRWPLGGDYLGMTTTSTGVFYPFWADARTGTFQLYTAPITVDLPPTAEEKARAEALAAFVPPTPPSDPSKRVERDILDLVDLVFDPTSVEGDVSELRVRLKNVSDETIYAPVRMEVIGFGIPAYEGSDEHAPELLNASNAETGAGAQFVFDLGSAGVLAPEAASGTIPIRVREERGERTPPIRYKLYGFVDPARE